MTQEEKQLLLKDLCARLPYWPNIETVDDDDAYIVGLDDTESGLFYVHVLEDGDSYDTTMLVEDFKPYLRSMSSMTDEERDEFRTLGGVMSHNVQNDTWAICAFAPEAYDWLNEHHFDYRGLIEKGLALEAPKDMYKTK